MDILYMTKEDFKKVPYLETIQPCRREPLIFDSLVIIPTNEKHDSEFMCMEFIACYRQEPLCRLGGISDVVHLDGIAGRGLTSKDHGDTSKFWRIDCLQSGYLRLWTGSFLTLGSALSDFEVLQS